MTLTEEIRRCHLFHHLAQENVDLLTTICRKRQCVRGELLFEDGQPAAGFYIIVSGKVKIYKLSSDGRERILHIVQPGSSFADAAIFGNGRYPAFAETLAAAELLFFPKNEFLDLLHQHSQLAINMIAGLSSYLRQFTSQIEDLTFRDVPARLANYLITQVAAGASTVVLPLSKAQLASNLGTTSETLSRTLRKLTDDELIAVQGKTIELIDFERLEELAHNGGAGYE